MFAAGLGFPSSSCPFKPLIFSIQPDSDFTVPSHLNSLRPASASDSPDSEPECAAVSPSPPPLRHVGRLSAEKGRSLPRPRPVAATLT